MIIAFDISYIQKKRAGIGRAALSVLQNLLEHDRTNEYILHGWSFSLDIETIKIFKKPNVQLSLLKIPGNIKRFYWNRFRTPNIEYFLKSINIFHSSDPLLPPLHTAKSIITIHDLSYKKYPYLFQKQVLNWDKYILKSIKRADAIITPSDQSRNDIIEFFPSAVDKINVVHFPIESIFTNIPETNYDSLIKSKYNLDNPFILFVGTIEPRKNLVNLIRAFEMFQHKHKSPLQLVICGKLGWLYRDIFEAIKQSSIVSTIRYFNYLPEKELASLYRLARIFVFPSLYEGYGFPVLESMASGTPVITSNTSSLKEIAEGAAILVDPTNVDELADAMMRLSENDSLRTELSRRGLERIKFFNPETAAEQVLNIYKQLS